MTPKFEILPGLPPYGPLTEAFSATGQGTHREGMVVRFVTQSDSNSVANFQPGSGESSDVFEHPDGENLIVIARGQGYVIDPGRRRCLTTFGSAIQSVFIIRELNAIAFGNGIWFEAIGRGGRLWRSDRISWDGMKDLNIEGLTLKGLAWDLSNQWIPFIFDVSSGEFTGGSYKGRVDLKP